MARSCIQRRPLHSFVVAAIVLSGIQLGQGARADEAPKAGDVQISVDYLYVMDRLDPDPKRDVKTRRSLTLRLSETGEIHSDIKLSSINRETSFDKERHDTANLGKEGGRAAWKVVDQKTIEGHIKWGKGELLVTIAVTDQSAKCSAKIALLPGPGDHDFFLKMTSREDTVGHYGNFRLTRADCKVTKL